MRGCLDGAIKQEKVGFDSITSSTWLGLAWVWWRERTYGDTWESNPPGTALLPHNGFEDRTPHQRRSIPIEIIVPSEKALSIWRATVFGVTNR